MLILKIYGTIKKHILHFSFRTKPSYVEELEKKYNIELPSVFKAFVQTFEFGKFEPQNEHEVIHTNKKVGYDGFELTLEQCVKVYKSDDQYLENGVIPIASCIYSGGICLGIQQQ